MSHHPRTLWYLCEQDASVRQIQTTAVVPNPSQTTPEGLDPQMHVIVVYLLQFLQFRASLAFARPALPCPCKCSARRAY